MGKTNPFSTMRRARTIGRRHPDVSASVALVALNLATYANGRSGTMIRPGFGRVAEDTGLHVETVSDAVRWLEQHQEIRRDSQGRRGSAACFTYLGVGQDDDLKVGADTRAIERKPGAETAIGGVDRPTHQPHQDEPARSADKVRSADDQPGNASDGGEHGTPESLPPRAPVRKPAPPPKPYTAAERARVHADIERLFPPGS